MYCDISTMLYYNQIVQIRLAHQFYTDFQYFLSKCIFPKCVIPKSIFSKHIFPKCISHSVFSQSVFSECVFHIFLKCIYPKCFFFFSQNVPDLCVFAALWVYFLFRIFLAKCAWLAFFQSFVSLFLVSYFFEMLKYL